MIRAGDSIHNPVTGERIVFRQTSADTNGEAVVIETYVEPHGFVAAAHVHPSQEERFQVLRGTVGFKIGGKKQLAGPGTRVTVPAGTPHTFWNAGEETAQFVCEVRPALQFESLLETMFALAGGRSPQSASTSRSRGTAEPRRRRSSARSARCFGPPSATAPLSPTTSTGPNSRNSTRPSLAQRASSGS